MSDIKWIKISTDVFNNRKIRQIERMPKGDSMIVIWFKLLCLAGKTNDRGLIYLTPEVPFTEDMLAVEFCRTPTLIRQALDTFRSFGMIEIVENIISLPSWEKYQNIDQLERIKIQNRERKQRQRDKQHEVTGQKHDCHVTVTGHDRDCHATDKDIDIDIPPKPPLGVVNEFFESMWRRYPNKRGKGSVSEAAKRRIFSVGKDQMERCISRYLKDLEREEWRKPQNGSRFFNSGYLDYTDENYVEPETDEAPAWRELE